MQNKNKSSLNSIKILFIFLSIITVAFSLTGNILISNKGGVSLLTFESFYVYVITIAISLYMTLTNKNANIVIFISILTYLWTYYLVQQMITLITDVQISIGTHFYIYLSSVIFLILSLFFNNKKEISTNTNTINNTNTGTSNNTNTSNNQQPVTNKPNNDFNENKCIFTHFLTGIKGIPLNTMILLVNNIPDNTLDLIYSVNNNEKDSKTIKLPINTINNISFYTKTRIENINKKVEENETKSALLSAVVFGGNPLLQLAGSSGFNSLFDSVSNNYNKVGYTTYYEITIETLTNNQELIIVLTTETNPETFINEIPNKEHKTLGV